MKLIYAFCKITTLGTNNGTGQPRTHGLDGSNNNYYW